MKNLQSRNLVLAVVIAMAGVGCSDDNDDIPLPDINGYPNSDAVASANLVAYYPFDGSGTEKKSNLAPTSSVNATYVAGGVKGQALNLNNGYVYYASPMGTLTSNQGFTLSAWVQVTNNGVEGQAPPVGNYPYSYFQSAIPGQLFGNLTAMVEAGQYKVASDTLVLKSIYKDLNNGTQDNINNYGIAGTEFQVVKKAGTNQWVHIVTTYTPTGGVGGNKNIFRIYADSVMVSNTNFEDRGTNSFKYTAGETIIGGWYNNIPGKEVTTDTWTLPFKGKIDEIRVFNKLLTREEITALYKLGKAGR